MKKSKFKEGPLMGLSKDLILEILFRLPVKSLGKLKCVSKKWEKLISNPGFAISHLEFSNSTTPPLTAAMVQYNSICSLNFKSCTDITEGVNLTRWGRQFDDANVFDERYFFMIGSCDGLLCLYIKETDKRKQADDLMYLWNPITNETREISLPVGGKSTYVHVDSCWFGFVNSTNDYKILLVCTVYKPHRQYMLMYSLKNDSWREIRVSGEDLSSISGNVSVFMDDALHFLGHRCILKLDLVSVTFVRIPFSIMPESFPSVDQMLLGVLGEYDCLCVVFVHYSNKGLGKAYEEDSEEDSEEEDSEDSEEEVKEEECMLEMWVLEEYNNWNSWKKMYRIDLEKEIAGLCTKLIGLTYNGIICIRTMNDGFVVVDPSWDPPSYVIVRKHCEKVHNVADYVETLVSPFSPFASDDDDDDDEESDDDEDDSGDGGGDGDDDDGGGVGGCDDNGINLTLSL
ncbi:F-box/kelch-repeat protein At3g06240-like [Spinacia oleracea]|uniref:F-box/kelch-repeat protein At3g06240-like n=1 Tax=Spinacia oleracea TaxID=3562 RepID=A0ABM3RFK8_SPIOL|nr:F-box/kelch-repeat protein At3g06240-like [Spinacia oleracea]